MRRAALLILGLLLAGCVVSTEFIPSGGGQLRRWDGPVELRDSLPAGPYQRVGIVVAHGGASDSTDEMIRALRERAAAKGANAIILSGPRSVEGETLGTLPKYRMTAIAIRVRE